MIEFRHRVDAVMHCLAHVASVQSDQSSTNDESSLKFIGTRFRELSSCDEARKMMRHLTSGNEAGGIDGKISIPLNLLRVNANETCPYEMSGLPPEETIKQELGKGKTSIFVTGPTNIGPLSTEQLSIDLVDVNEDADSSLLSSKPDSVERETIIGNILYRQILRRMSRFISDADLFMTPEQIQLLSKRALTLAFMMDAVYCHDLTSIALRKLFGSEEKSNESQIITKSIKLDKHTINCEIGTLDWAAGSCGLGLTVASKTR